MNQINLEHVNYTASDPKKTAEMLCLLFGWKIRWEGEAIDGGYTYHVGSDQSYVAVYAGKSVKESSQSSYTRVGGLNHIAVVVEDLEEIEQRIVNAGLEVHSHGDYEPGRRFYFNDHDGIEYEVVSYSTTKN